MIDRGLRRGGACVFAIALSMAPGACASNRTPERSFTTRADAAASGMFDGAGVPGVLVPESAQQLRERRDLGTGAIWARFEFAEGDAPSTSACQPTGEAVLGGSATRGIGWWPELLRNDVATARQHFELFACPAGGAPAGYLAVHRAMTTAFFWRVR